MERLLKIFDPKCFIISTMLFNFYHLNPSSCWHVWHCLAQFVAHYLPKTSFSSVRIKNINQNTQHQSYHCDSIISTRRGHGLRNNYSMLHPATSHHALRTPHHPPVTYSTWVLKIPSTMNSSRTSKPRVSNAEKH